MKSIIYLDREDYKKMIQCARENSPLDQSVQPYPDGGVLFYNIQGDSITVTNKLPDGGIKKFTIFSDGKVYTY